MAEEVTIFIRPNENYTYKTPFQTINIVQMSEDEQDDPDPRPPTPEPKGPLLTAFSLNGADYINFSEIEWETRPSGRIYGLTITKDGLSITGSGERQDDVLYYVRMEIKSNTRFKTKYNNIIEIQSALDCCKFYSFNLKSIIPCTDEMAETFNSYANFKKLNKISDGLVTEPINYTNWSTQNDITGNYQNVCYIPNSDELYIGYSRSLPETTSGYFKNYSLEYTTPTRFYQDNTNEAVMIIRAGLCKITKASKMFNMTHD